MPDEMGSHTYSDLIPELKAWNDGKGITAKDWISAVGSIQHAIGYAIIFWPEFITHDGCIFRADSFNTRNYQKFLIQTAFDKSKVEAVMNHLHILDLFATENVTENQVIFLGQILRDMWKAKLAQDFPERVFNIIFSENGHVDLLDYELTFFQLRD